MAIGYVSALTASKRKKLILNQRSLWKIKKPAAVPLLIYAFPTIQKWTLNISWDSPFNLPCVCVLHAVPQISWWGCIYVDLLLPGSEANSLHFRFDFLGALAQPIELYDRRKFLEKENFLIIVCNSSIANSKVRTRVVKCKSLAPKRGKTLVRWRGGPAIGQPVQTDVTENARALVRSNDMLFRRFLTAYRLHIDVCHGADILGGYLDSRCE